jgi:hypothetical protein
MKKFITSNNKFCYVFVLSPTSLVEKVAITLRFLQSNLISIRCCSLKLKTLTLKEFKKHDVMAVNLSHRAILCGGSGVHLFLPSPQSFLKQFALLIDGKLSIS